MGAVSNGNRVVSRFRAGIVPNLTGAPNDFLNATKSGWAGLATESNAAPFMDQTIDLPVGGTRPYSIDAIEFAHLQGYRLPGPLQKIRARKPSLW